MPVITKSMKMKLYWHENFIWSISKFKKKNFNRKKNDTLIFAKKRRKYIFSLSLSLFALCIGFLFFIHSLSCYSFTLHLLFLCSLSLFTLSLFLLFSLYSLSHSHSPALSSPIFTHSSLSLSHYFLILCSKSEKFDDQFCQH